MAKGSKDIGYWVMFQEKRIFVYLQRHAAFDSIFLDIYGAKTMIFIFPHTHTLVCAKYTYEHSEAMWTSPHPPAFDCTEGFEIMKCFGLSATFVCSPLGVLLFVSLVFGFRSLSKHAAFIKCGLLTQPLPPADAELTTRAHTRC